MIISMTIEVTHLHYVDDTLLFCPWSDGRLMAWWSVVNLFLMESGLSLNVSKMFLIGVNPKFDEIDFHVSILGGKVESNPLNYLGFPIGGKHGAEVVTKALEEEFKLIEKWRGLVVSKGCRITLSPSVLNSFRCYFLSLM